MGIESDSSLYPYPTIKEVITMKRLNSIFTFTPCEGGYPYIKTKDNANGTHKGYLDLNNMSLKQKLEVVSDIANDTINQLANPSAFGVG